MAPRYLQVRISLSNGNHCRALMGNRDLRGLIGMRWGGDGSPNVTGFEILGALDTIPGDPPRKEAA